MLRLLSVVAAALCLPAISVAHVDTTTSSSHARFHVNSKENVARILAGNVTNEVDMGLTLSPGVEGVACSEGDVCIDYGDEARLVVVNQDHCQRLTWTTQTLAELRDCVILKGHWYGGGEQFRQPWPIEKEPRVDTPYVTADMLQRLGEWYGGVTEAYWVSSTGLAIVVDEGTPLFLSLPDTDGDGIADEMCLSARQELPFAFAEEDLLTLDYYVCSADDVRQVHEATLPLFYGRPATIPDERMFREPIWCTWAEYKTEVNDSRVLQLAYNVIDKGYPYSQLEIDDNWETCYGSAIFNPERFPDPRSLVNELHILGFRVTMWIHPFINSDCTAFSYPDQMGYFVKDSNNQTQTTSWWQGSSAGIIDFTNPDAAAWWSQRLADLKESTGVDSFKFDAGETNWLPEVFTLQAEERLWPNIYTTKYVDAVSQFGDLIEVRSGRNNQGQPIFFRMLDKNSIFGYDNGLKTLMTTLLHFGLLGYPFVLPDMIGGNAYVGKPSEELFVRWTQANALMPTMQFSLLPWEFGATAEAVAMEMSQLHEQFAPQILEAAAGATQSPAAICRPTWWLCPTDEACLTADQQFLLGDDILVAPVTDEGAVEKVVVFPPGAWTDSQGIATYQGPSTQTFLDISLTTFLYFTRN